MRIISSGIGVLLIAFLHIAFPVFDQASEKYRHIWLPMTGGIAVGYVFLYLLPKISDYTQQFRGPDPQDWGLLQYWIYLLVLAGLLIYLKIDVVSSSNHSKSASGHLIQGVSFCLYSLLMGYVLIKLPRMGEWPIVLGTIAVGGHFLGIDHHMRHRQSNWFDRYFRWLMALGIIMGWMLGAFLYLPKWYVVAAPARSSRGEPLPT